MLLLRMGDPVNDVPVFAQDMTEKIGAVLNEIRQFPADKLIEDSLNILRNSPNELKAQEKKILEKLITVANKCQALESHCMLILIKLMGTVRSTLVGFRCGVDDNTVFEKFATNLGKTIKTELKEVCEDHVETRMAVNDVHINIKELIIWCEDEIKELDTEKESKVASKRQEYLTKLGWVLAVVNIIPQEWGQVAKLGTGIAGTVGALAVTESDVSTIKRNFEDVIERLNNREKRWSDCSKNFVVLEDELKESLKRWGGLRSEVDVSKNYCAFFSSTRKKSEKKVPEMNKEGSADDNKETREKLKAEFVKALTDIQDECDRIKRSQEFKGIKQELNRGTEQAA